MAAHYSTGGLPLFAYPAEPGPQEMNRMATAAPTQNLPLFYEGLEPLNVTQHGKMKVRAVPASPTMAKTHAVPLTVDEFMLVQRYCPIVFSVGDDPIRMVLMGLNEGVNVFLGDDGRPRDEQ